MDRGKIGFCQVVFKIWSLIGKMWTYFEIWLPVREVTKRKQKVGFRGPEVVFRA